MNINSLSLLDKRVQVLRMLGGFVGGMTTKRKTVNFEDQDQKSEEVEQNLGHENLSGEKDVEENRQVDQQDPGQES